MDISNIDDFEKIITDLNKFFNDRKISKFETINLLKTFLYICSSPYIKNKEIFMNFFDPDEYLQFINGFEKE